MANALRDKVASGELATVMAAHNPLSARLAEEAGFDGIWASGFELSAAYGVPDYERDRDGALRPGVPAIDMQVGAADAGAKDADEHIVDADGRLGHVLQP